LAATTTGSTGHSVARRRPHGRALVTLISVMILIGAEVFGVALAGGWALAGLFELGDVVGYVLIGIFALFGVYIMINVWHRASAYEAGR
jgi:hypothetical protein